MQRSCSSPLNLHFLLLNQLTATGSPRPALAANARVENLPRLPASPPEGSLACGPEGGGGGRSRWQLCERWAAAPCAGTAAVQPARCKLHSSLQYLQRLLVGLQEEREHVAVRALGRRGAAIRGDLLVVVVVGGGGGGQEAG